MNHVSGIRTIAIAATVVLAVACQSACLTGGDRKPGLFTLMSYNVMTLFDATDDGVEYDGFSVARGEWDETRYRARVEAMASAVRGTLAGGPDVLVVQEIENRDVLADLSEALGGYPVVLFPDSGDSPISVGILSRFPCVAARAHVPAGPDGAGSRVMLEAELDVSGRRFVVLAAHWKSKLGGDAETEPERARAAALAGAVIRARLHDDPGLAVALAGDLNESPDEYERAGKAYTTALMPASAGDGPWLRVSFERAGAGFDGGGMVMFCPWDEAGGYSYLHDGEEERIDNILASPGTVGGGPLRLVAFSAEPAEFLVDESGAPRPWNARTGSGWSDHLPVVATFAPTP